MELSNSLIYGNRLCCGSLEIANAKLKFSGREPVHLKLKEVTILFLKFSMISQFRKLHGPEMVIIQQHPFLTLLSNF
jgi:hypothetical protein